jgi:hypothetical protein
MTRLGSFEKRPELLHLLTAAFGTKRTYWSVNQMSAFGDKADSRRTSAALANG